MRPSKSAAAKVFKKGALGAMVKTLCPKRVSNYVGIGEADHAAFPLPPKRFLGNYPQLGSCFAKTQVRTSADGAGMARRPRGASLLLLLCSVRLARCNNSGG